jgi:hypothetical protein
MLHAASLQYLARYAGQCMHGSNSSSPHQGAAQGLGVESPPKGALMAREFSVIIQRDAEGYYVASVPALRGCHTQAKSLDELMARVREAVELCLEVL